MNSNVELLNEIYLGCKAGSSAINDLLDKVNKSEFKEELNKILGDYQELSEKVLNELTKYDEIAPEVGTMSKLSMWFATQMKTLGDSSEGHIAKMIIDGSNMGINNIVEKQNDLEDVSKNVTVLADRFIKIQEYNIEKMREYL